MYIILMSFYIPVYFVSFYLYNGLSTSKDKIGGKNKKENKTMLLINLTTMQIFKQGSHNNIMTSKEYKINLLYSVSLNL